MVSRLRIRSWNPIRNRKIEGLREHIDVCEHYVQHRAHDIVIILSNHGVIWLIKYTTVIESSAKIMERLVELVIRSAAPMPRRAMHALMWVTYVDSIPTPEN